MPNLAPDFWSVLRVVEQGYRAISEPTAVGSMTHVSSMTDEFTRKVRTLLRGITTLWRYAHLMNPFALRLLRGPAPLAQAGAVAGPVLPGRRADRQRRARARVAVVRRRARGPGRALPAGPRRPRRGAALRRLAARPHRLLLHRRQRRHAGRAGSSTWAASARKSGPRRSAERRDAVRREIDVPAAANRLRGGQHRRHDRWLLLQPALPRAGTGSPPLRAGGGLPARAHPLEPVRADRGDPPRAQAVVVRLRHAPPPRRLARAAAAAAGRGAERTERAPVPRDRRALCAASSAASAPTCCT